MSELLLTSGGQTMKVTSYFLHKFDGGKANTVPVHKNRIDIK